MTQFFYVMVGRMSNVSIILFLIDVYLYSVLVNPILTNKKTQEHVLSCHYRLHMRCYLLIRVPISGLVATR